MGKQLTLRGIDPCLEQALRAEAERRGVSLNEAALRLLESAIGLVHNQTRTTESPHFDDLDQLAGTRSPAEADELDAHLRKLRQVEPELWR